MTIKIMIGDVREQLRLQKRRDDGSEDIDMLYGAQQALGWFIEKLTVALVLPAPSDGIVGCDTISNRLLLNPLSKPERMKQSSRSARTSYSQPSTSTSVWNKLSTQRTIMVASQSRESEQAAEI